jgi:hypothetical protein
MERADIVGDELGTLSRSLRLEASLGCRVNDDHRIFSTLEHCSAKPPKQVIPEILYITHLLLL